MYYLISCPLQTAGSSSGGGSHDPYSEEFQVVDVSGTMSSLNHPVFATTFSTSPLSLMSSRPPPSQEASLSSTSEPWETLPWEFWEIRFGLRWFLDPWYWPPPPYECPALAHAARAQPFRPCQGSHSSQSMQPSPPLNKG